MPRRLWPFINFAAAYRLFLEVSVERLTAQESWLELPKEPVEKNNGPAADEQGLKQV